MDPKSVTNEQVEKNKKMVRQMLDNISKGDITGFTNYLTPDYVRHCQAMPPLVFRK